MRILVVFILLAVGLATEVKTQRLNDAKTQSEDSASLCLCDSASYYESQIRKADSLYKNYLPQYNFEEVKAAVEFLDSLNSCQSSAVRRHQSKFSKLHGLKPNLIDTLTYRLINFNCAKAHYYHAVGLTEKDDIVGACEHYLIALEIMEDMMAKDKSLRKKDKRLKAKVDNPEEYEKIRFVALIYNRLGRLYNNEGFCDLAILKYKKALGYVDLINDNSFKANLLKELANSYQLTNKADSALYYYNESLKTNDDFNNKLDVEKSIAQILFNKGEKDSAYFLLKDNIDKICDKNLKYSYHFTLGNMFYIDNEYDLAIYYLEKSLDSSIITRKLAFTTTLSSIYDSLGNTEKKAYYNDKSTKLFFDDANNDLDKSQLQTLYNDYNKRKIEKEKSIDRKKKRNKTIIISIITIVVVISVIVHIRHKYRKQNDKLNKKIDDYANENKQLIEVFHKTNSKKDRIIKQQKKEISEIKNQLSKKSDIDIEAYYNSEICKYISGRKESEFTPLTNEELTLLLEAADNNLGNISSRLCEQMPSLNKNDIYTICLIILNIEKNKFPYLLGRDRKTIYDRLNKIKTQMNLGPKQDLFIHIRDTYLN